jgi:hypothetical protein
MGALYVLARETSLNFVRLLHVHSAPDTTCRRCRALDSESLEWFDLRAGRVEQ